MQRPRPYILLVTFLIVGGMLATGARVCFASGSGGTAEDRPCTDVSAGESPLPGVLATPAAMSPSRTSEHEVRLRNDGPERLAAGIDGPTSIRHALIGSTAAATRGHPDEPGPSILNQLRSIILII